MKNIWRILIALVIVAIGYFIYLNTDYYIAKQSWKYRNGLHIGDWVVFNRGVVTLKGRKIYKEGVQIARIKINTGRMLIITSVNGDTSGYYINK